MAEVDRWSDVLDENMRAVWPTVAAAIAGTDGRLMGGTAVAIHLRHRTSDDLDAISLRPFAARAVAGRLRSSFPESYEEAEVAAERAGDVREALGSLRRDHVLSTSGPELRPKRTDGGLLRGPGPVAPPHSLDE